MEQKGWKELSRDFVHKTEEKKFEKGKSCWKYAKWMDDVRGSKQS